LPITLLSFPFTESPADELSLLLGSGPQAGSEQRNEVAGVEYGFYTLQRSARQHLQIGVSYSRFQSNKGPPGSMYAVSIYPQLTFYPSPTSKIARSMPSRIGPYFFVRMLAPTYISESTLGERNQANHFAFLAEVGAGITVDLPKGRHALINVTWRHISNANLSSPNDGIDVPFTVKIGVRY
jgi:hypothetical protein